MWPTTGTGVPSSLRMSEAKVHCLRCFLEEIDPEAYERDIKRILDMMPDKEKARPELYRSRLAVCRECTYLSDATCGACGCYVELRAAAADGRCPYGKWKKNGRKKYSESRNKS